ncbi:MAG TPA: aminoglycoside phosphotransferase family protein, partial [Hanamia sp.]|nr:aminoglycoside phosphotransferase family protein [Hanamia sp.]
MIKEEVFAAYRLDSKKVEIAPLQNGLINSTWKIKNNDQYFILQEINTEVFKNPEAIASNIRLIADYLHSTDPGYLFVAPVKTRTGEEMVKITTRTYFRLFPFVENSHTIATVEKPQQAFEAAKKFGEFTKLLASFPVERLQITLPDFHNLTLRYQQFCDALQTGNKVRLQQSKKLIELIEANKQIVDTYENILQNPSFKMRVTHHDTKISNVLFDNNDKGLCVIDLDTVMP